MEGYKLHLTLSQADKIERREARNDRQYLKALLDNYTEMKYIRRELKRQKDTKDEHSNGF